MTPDQEMERVERIAKLLSEPDLRSVRESRQQTERLILLFEKQKSTDRLRVNPEADHHIQKLNRQLKVYKRNEALLIKRAELRKQQADRDKNESD
jgi:hypothetical protein